YGTGDISSGDGGDDAGVGGDTKADTTSSSSSGTGGMTGTGGMGTGGEPGFGGDMGSGGMGPQCNAPQHLCGGICVGNTPATGCYQSMSCTACPNVPNGTATCTMDGYCGANCNPGYMPSGTTCVCQSQCCSDADCGSGSSCQNGTCVADCDQALCIAACLLQMKVGICVSNSCVCV
ncbi:MAG: hypothetical protein KC731_30390, partial [Myxococcales bacterium]|nr:hypothetical protein [Myxococcales bacterium]